MLRLSVRRLAAVGRGHHGLVLRYRTEAQLVPAYVRSVERWQDPAGVMQEMRALFAVYQAICRIVGIAVNAAGVPPAQISFPHALAAAKDSVAAFSP
jgi:hypothetical protein